MSTADIKTFAYEVCIYRDNLLRRVGFYATRDQAELSVLDHRDDIVGHTVTICRHGRALKSWNRRMM